MFVDIFRRRKPNTEKLRAFGFEARDGHFVYDTEIMNGDFQLTVTVTKNGGVDTRLLEKDTDEPYVLYKTDAAGTFVGAVRAEIEGILTEISERCYDASVFKNDQTLAIIDYVREKYGDEPEYLWQKFPENAIWRRQDNQKWYGAVLTVVGRKIGLPTDEVVEIIDLRLGNGQTVDNNRFFPGWHMNKKSWYTIILDGRVTTEEIFTLIDESYRLAKK